MPRCRSAADRLRSARSGYPGNHVTKDCDRMGLSANLHSTPETIAARALRVNLVVTGRRAA